MFSYRTKWQLTPDTYRAAIKAVAKSMGLDPSRYSSHSLRIAGAPALVAAGKPDWFIKRWGRWQSLAFLHYIQFSVPSMREAVTTIISPSCFTIADLIATPPGFSPRGGGIVIRLLRVCRPALSLTEGAFFLRTGRPTHPAPSQRAPY